MYVLKSKNHEETYFLNCCCVTGQIQHACKFLTLEDANKDVEDYAYLDAFLVEEV